MRQLPSVDKQELGALVQSWQSSDDDDGEMSLETATFESHTCETVGVAINFLDNAQNECDQTRHADLNAVHSCDAQAVS